MALIHADPFAHYLAAQVNDVYTNGPGGAAVTIGAFGPNGRPGLRFTGDLDDSLVRTVTTSGAVCVFQGDLRISAFPASTNVIFAPLLGGSVQCSVDITSAGKLAVHRGFAGTKTQLGSDSTYVIPTDTHINIAAKFTIADGVGGSIVVHVWEDGDTAAQVVLNVTGVDTKEGASATWDGFDLGAGCNGTTDWSNVIVMDGSGSTMNDFLGPADVWALFANARAASALTDWTLSAGTDAAALTDDASPDDDSTYLEETTQNQQMTVAVDTVPYPGRTILGAQLYASVKLTSGTPTIEPIGYQSGSPELGTSFSPTAAYTYLMQPYSAMPDATAFTTAAAFDALQWGLKLTSAATGARVTQIVVAVIQSRDTGGRNFVTGYSHTVSGDDNVATGQSNSVTGAMSQAHGSGATVVGDRTVVFNLDGVPRTVTGNGRFEVYGTIGGDLLAARAVVSASSESIANDTLQDDNELALTVEASAVYLVELLAFFTTGTSTAVDAKFGFTFPSGAVFTYAVFGYTAAATANDTTAWSTPASLAMSSPSGPNSRGVISTGTSPGSPVRIQGVLRMSSTAGTLQFQFAQSVSTGGTPLVREANSFLKLTRVS
jgi:hypothetical protein